MKIEKQSTKLIKPLIPTPKSLSVYNLSFIDELLPFIKVSLALFFPSNTNNHNQNFVVKLEKSLEKTLTRFYPLAGRYDDVDGIQTVNCNDEGAEFIHAKVNIKLQDFLSLEGNENLVDDFIPLSKTWVVLDPLLAIQVTMFECGGVAIGVSSTHKIVDASTLCTFLHKWADTHTGTDTDTDTDIDTDMNRSEENEKELFFKGPCFNSSTMFPPRGLPSLPVTPINEDMFSNFVRKKVFFSESEISKMKAKNTGIYYSRVQLVSAVIWKALISVDPRESLLFQPVNLRGKMASLIPQDSCGNLIGFCCAKSKSRATTEELVALLDGSVKRVINDFSKVSHDSEEGKAMVLDSILNTYNMVSQSENVVMFASWCKFPFYEVDFGFVKPVWVVPGTTLSMNSSVFMMDDARTNGVEAYVCLWMLKTSLILRQL